MIVKKASGLLLAAVGALCATGALAGTSPFGYVTGVGSLSDGRFYFNMSSGHQNAPACQGTYVPDRWALNVNTPAGQGLAATILTAFAAHKQVFVSGTSSCSDLGDTETAGIVEVAD